MSKLFGSPIRTKPAHEQNLSFKRAMARMQTGSRLVLMHGGKPNERHWFVVPGGSISKQTSTEIRNHPSVIGGKDGLFSDHDQTWRMKSFMRPTKEQAL
jgi:hypothetical protein